MSNKYAIIIVAFVVIVAGVYFFFSHDSAIMVTNFEECIATGNPTMESYPRQCRAGEQIFTEFIGNEIEKIDLIRINTPRPNQTISNPLTIMGEARGNWFFEASFPIVLTDWDGKIIAQGIAQAKSNWMTTEFVPFETTLTFTIDKSAVSNKGTLILHKDNPSGLPEHDDALEIPIVFAGVTGTIKPPLTVCTQEAKLCPDGSYVSRTGPNCEFANCPVTEKFCLKDSDCSSSKYMCQETQGYGTACPSNDSACVSTHTVIAGECKIKEGYECSADSQCAVGNLCHNNVCTSPIGTQCAGPNDTSCPADFKCVQGCGSPVARPDDPPVLHYCQLNEYIQNCPICLSKNTFIDTPLGAIAVQELRKGSPIWTINKSLKRVSGVVIETSKTLVPLNHNMVKLVLADGRTLLVSPGHPTIDGRAVGDLATDDLYDGALIVSSNRIIYNDAYTYDILVSGETGFYFANGVLLDSTLR